MGSIHERLGKTQSMRQNFIDVVQPYGRLAVAKRIEGFWPAERMYLGDTQEKLTDFAAKDYFILCLIAHPDRLGPLIAPSILVQDIPGIINCKMENPVSTRQIRTPGLRTAARIASVQLDPLYTPHDLEVLKKQGKPTPDPEIKRLLQKKYLASVHTTASTQHSASFSGMAPQGRREERMKGYTDKRGKHHRTFFGNPVATVLNTVKDIEKVAVVLAGIGFPNCAGSDYSSVKGINLWKKREVIFGYAQTREDFEATATKENITRDMLAYRYMDVIVPDQYKDVSPLPYPSSTSWFTGS